jgi:ankyrin repeat protein
MAGTDDPLSTFIVSASVPLDGSGHAYGTLDRAREILAAHPEVATADIYAAAILGDEAAVRRFVEGDPASATRKGGRYGWDPLTSLCFSRFLRLDESRADAFVRAARVLLDAGANANTGFFEKNHQPAPEFESAMYGAAGIAHHPGLTKLLLEYGADPNDNETPYHVIETFDNRALKILVESGKLTADSMATLLLRKHDWHDYDAIKWLLEHGANPNAVSGWKGTPFFHAVQRDNSIGIIELSLDHGADPTIAAGGGQSAAALAARRGRGDALDLFAQRGIRIDFAGVDRLIAACALNDGETIRSIAAKEPQLVRGLVTEGGPLLAEFAGNGNTEGVRQLLDLGVDVNARHAEGDPYFGVAKNSTALHAAAWRARHATVRLLIERGAQVDAKDANGRTPLMLAVRACVDSYWTDRRKPDSVAALLTAGASTAGVAFPSGYDEVDGLLGKAGARG